MKHRTLSDNAANRLIAECNAHNSNESRALARAGYAANRCGVMDWRKEKQTKEALLREIGVVFTQHKQQDD